MTSYLLESEVKNRIFIEDFYIIVILIILIIINYKNSL